MEPGQAVSYLEPDAPGAGLSPAELEVVERFNRKVAAGRDLDEVLGHLVEAVRATGPCDRLSLALVEEGGRRLRSRWVWAAYEPVRLAPGWAAEVAGSSLERVIAEGAPRVIEDLAAYLEAHPHSASTRLMLAEGARSSMTCPLRVEGRTAGVLFRSSRQPGAYDARQVALHLALAERLSQAVEKAVRIAELEQANQAYAEMLGFVSHELRSPLAAIVSTANTLAEGYYGPLAEPVRERIGRMRLQAERLLGLTRDYLDLAWLDSGEMRIRPEPEVELVARVIAPAEEAVEPLWRERGMRYRRLVPEGPLVARCDPALLCSVLTNLLANGAKYGREGGALELAITRDEARLTLAVFNQGPGFPPEDQARLFRRFSRLPRPELLRQKGTGLGLYLAWRIVEAHGGRIRAESEPGQWARFTVELPAGESGVAGPGPRAGPDQGGS
jgi:hypothetical protein